MNIQPKTSSAKDKNGDYYVATSFNVIATDIVNGPVQNVVIIFKDSSGNVIPTGAIPLVSNVTYASEAQSLSTAISTGVALSGETRSTLTTRLAAPIVVATRGVILLA